MLLVFVSRLCLPVFLGILYLTRTAAVPVGASSSDLVTHDNDPPPAPIMVEYEYCWVINGPDSANPVILGEALQIIMDSFGIMKSLSPETKFEVKAVKGSSGTPSTVHDYGYLITFRIDDQYGSLSGPYSVRIPYVKGFNKNFPKKRAKILSGTLLQWDGRDYEPVLSFREGKMQSGPWEAGRETLDLVDHRKHGGMRRLIDNLRLTKGSKGSGRR